ncbi:MAG: nuclear transport factor 2 family protein [Chloroflexota bacterium]
MEQAIVARIRAHFEAIGKDAVAAAAIYAEDAVLEYPQSGERIASRANIVASRAAYPGRPSSFEVDRVIGVGDVWIAELTLHIEGDDPHCVVALLELRDDVVVSERIYIAEPWEAPAYRAQWVEPRTG